jgi:cell wall-associated NlpC family hydrolase
MNKWINHNMFKALIHIIILLPILLGCTPGRVPADKPLIEPGTVEFQQTSTSILSTQKPSLSTSFTSSPTDTRIPATLSPSITSTPTSTPQPDDWATVSSEFLAVWDDPAHEGDYWSRQTELVTGERVLVIGHQGLWTQIVAVEQPSKKDSRGYPGWVRSEGLVMGWQVGDLWVVVIRQVSVLTDREGNSEILMVVNMDSRLVVLQQSVKQLQVLLPNGRPGWIPTDAVRLTTSRDSSFSVDGLFKTIETMIGVPYVWGGTTSRSVDCSGLFYRAFHVYGIVLARDADDQILAGSPVESTQLRKGDLIFMSDRVNGPVTHVAMYWGNGLIVDAEPEQGVSIHLLNDLLQTMFWSGARRYLPDE